jgi:hypothetical protein
LALRGIGIVGSEYAPVGATVRCRRNSHRSSRSEYRCHPRRQSSLLPYQSSCSRLCSVVIESSYDQSCHSRLQPGIIGVSHFSQFLKARKFESNCKEIGQLQGGFDRAENELLFRSHDGLMMFARFYLSSEIPMG